MFQAASSDLSAADLVEELAQTRRCLDIAELAFCAKAAQVAQSSAYRDLGYCSPLDWIRKQTKMEAGRAADLLCVGEQMAFLPQSVEAMIAGEIGLAHLVVIARTAEALRESKTSGGFEESRLLERARNEESLTSFRTYCLHYRHAQDPQAYAEDEVLGVEARSLEITGASQGMAWVKGFLDPAGAAALRSALEPLARKSGADDGRDRKRRFADALVDLATRELDSGSLPLRAGQRPHLQVTTSLETLLGRPGSPAAEMEFAVPISSQMVQRIACDCSLTRILLGADSAVIDVGRARRVVTPALAKALRARDRHCAWPGCERPVQFTSAHHLVHWIHGGPTDLDNLALLCFRHHQMAHEGGWQLVRSDDGRILTVPPKAFGQTQARGPD